MVRASDSDAAPVMDVQSWLGTALDAWFREDAGRWAFQPFALSIGHDPELARDLVAVYGGRPASEQDRWQQAVRDLLAERGADASFRPAVEVLLDLATLMPATRVLEVLPRLVDADDSPEARRMGNRVVGAAVSLARQTDGAVRCLEQIRTSPRFATHHAGLVLTALCRADPDGWTAHMTHLERAMRRLASEYLTDRGALRLYATSIISSITLERVTVEALDRLSDGLASTCGERWNWFCDELLRDEDSLAVLDGKRLWLRDNPLAWIELDASAVRLLPRDPLPDITLPEQPTPAIHHVAELLQSEAYWGPEEDQWPATAAA